MTDQEPYTRVPNALLDNMADLGNAELRVLLAVTRKTAGYQKECDRISVSQVAAMTGLTSRNAQSAIASLLERGLLSREQVGKQSYCYRLTMSPRDTVENHIPSDTISLGDTEAYPVGTRLEAKPYPLGITQKKDLKKKEKTLAAASDDAPPPAKKSRTKPAEEGSPAIVRETLADVCGINMGRSGVREDKLEVNTTGKLIWQEQQALGKTPEDVCKLIAYVAKWCMKNAWECTRGRPSDAPLKPRPTHIRKYWTQAAEAHKRSRQNGSHAPAAPTMPVDTRTPEQRAADLAAKVRALGAGSGQ